jgi:hypothetical protein
LIGAGLGRWLGTAVLASATAFAAPADPWPGSPVLTRLFGLPSSRADVARLSSELKLSAFQLQSLRQLSAGETRLARLGEAAQSRQQAQAVNIQLAALRTEKDRKARIILGSRYPAFRGWLRVWWQLQVTKSRKP